MAMLAAIYLGTPKAEMIRIIVGGSLNGNSYAYGDAGGDMTEHAQGGDDVLDGSHAPFVYLYGDAGGSMSGYAIGGNDTIVGGNSGQHAGWRCRREHD